MMQRTEAIARTRRKILEATIRLHGRNGIFGTSWQDIAREADVALGTVYKHFPSLTELVPACGDLLMQKLGPPSPDDVDGIIGDASEPEERLRRVARALFAFYERGGELLESDPRERQLEPIREWEAYLQSMVSRFADRALSDLDLDEDDVEAVAALLDFRTFRAMRTRGFSVERCVELAVKMALAWPDQHRDRHPDTQHVGNSRRKS